MAANLETISDELYGLTPGEFTAARDAHVSAARQGGDRKLAVAIKALRRPAVSAWLANWLVRERSNDIGRLLDLGAALREAQTQLDAEDLRHLSRQRRQVVSALSAEAGRWATEAGMAVTAKAERELEETLEAALADEAAGTALLGGRLTTALHYAGWASSDLDHASEPEAVKAKPNPAHDEVGAQRQKRQEETAAAHKETAAAEGRQQQRDAAAKALRAAEAEVADAQGKAEEHQRLLEEAAERHEQLRQSVADLEDQLTSLRREVEEATSVVASAQKAKDAADRTVKAARDRAATTREQLDRLRVEG